MRIATISVHGCPCIQPGGTDAGGMNVYVDQVSERLSRLGHDVDVYSRIHAGMEKGFNERTYNLTHVSAGELALPKEHLPRVLQEFVSEVVDVTEDRSCGYDLLTSHYWLSGVVGCELSNIWEAPHVTSFHTLASIKKRFWPDEDEPEIRFVSEAQVARDVDTVVVWTEGEAEHMMTQFGLPRDKFNIVPPGVDTDCFSFTPIASEQNTKSTILYVGRLDALKGVDLLLDAFAIIATQIPDVDLQIVGGGSADEFRRVLGRIASLRLADRIKLPGVLPQSELPKIYSDAACIVAPSFHETFGLAVLEAAACGTPAIAADVDGLRSIVDDGNTGYLIREREPTLYAEKISEIVENPPLRKQMSIAARNRAEELSWDGTVANLSEIYNRISLARSIPAPLR